MFFVFFRVNSWIVDRSSPTLRVFRFRRCPESIGDREKSGAEYLNPSPLLSSLLTINYSIQEKGIDRRNRRNKIKHRKQERAFGGCALIHPVNPVHPVKLFFLKSIERETPALVVATVIAVTPVPLIVAAQEAVAISLLVGVLVAVRGIVAVGGVTVIA